jgi:hypothetical protein
MSAQQHERDKIKTAKAVKLVTLSAAKEELKHCDTCDKNNHNTPDLRLTPTQWGMLCRSCLRDYQDYQSRNQRHDDD